jgi:multidrug resistance efflux pump
MAIVILITFVYCFGLWLVFFKFKWLRLSPAVGVISVFVGAHLFLTFIIGLRFVTPFSASARIVQHTIQLVPRLPEPTLLTAVLAPADYPVKGGQPLFQFDRRPYEPKVRQLEADIQAAQAAVLTHTHMVATAEHKVTQLQAALVSATYDVRIIGQDVEAAGEKVSVVNSELEYAKLQQIRYQDLAEQKAGPVEDAQKWRTQTLADEAGVKEASADAQRSRLRYDSQLDGVNTIVASAAAKLKEGESSLQEAQSALQEAIAHVASLKAELTLARYYLDQTTMVAPEDGHIVNLQARPGMVAGILRVGGIASFICDDDRYLLATYYQEHLKYVQVGQPVEVEMDLYPGQIFKGKVDAIWWANGEGQYLPSDIIPTFEAVNPQLPQGQFAVKIGLESSDKTRFPIGAQGGAAIYTSAHGGFVTLRRIAIRMTTWFNWLYPMPF